MPIQGEQLDLLTYQPQFQVGDLVRVKHHTGVVIDGRVGLVCPNGAIGVEADWPAEPYPMQLVSKQPYRYFRPREVEPR